MCNQEHLIGYVYGELSVAERAAFEAHVSSCRACREELQALGEARQHLTSWAPPDPALDFRVIRGGAPPPPRRRPLVPAWGLAAAASLLLLAGAAAIANLEMRYGPDGLVVRTGWAEAARMSNPARGGAEAVGEVERPALSPVSSSEQTEAVRAQLAALQDRLDRLERAEVANRPASNTGPSERQLAVMSANLRKLLAESEQRQRNEMALQVAEIWKDFNAVRASDITRLQQTVGRAQVITNSQLKQQRESIESLGTLYRVSLQK